ncbi:MAG: M13 family metallopeptidase N-terminal domain-containing protein, partial [Pyrinomonadaceae bacterium]
MHKTFFQFATTALVLVSLWSSTLAQGKGFDTGRMDKSADACNDFFQYANGTWLRSTQIPASESRWGTFNILADNNNSLLREILETSAKTKAAKGTDAQLIGDYYSSCMDQAAINKAGIKPIKRFLRDIDKVQTVADLEKEIAALHGAGLPAVFGFGASPDLKNSNNVIANASQGGLTLPNRDYYTGDD